MVHRTKKKKVVVFGVFDLLHPGHLAFLKAARRLGSSLTVVVTRDERVRREKGRVPVFNERERLRMIKSLHFVSSASLGDAPGSHSVLTRLRPDIVAIGHDQKIPAASRGSWKFVRLKAKRRDRYSTSRIRNALFSPLS